jgi:maltose alpha-D-glucosyltransferase/alpha-amylase
MSNARRFPVFFVWLAAVPAFFMTGTLRAQENQDKTKDTLTAQLSMTKQERWYKNCFIYNLDVRTFQDSDGDGTGDFPGLTARLPYLKSLGVDVIWLAPFQPSPHLDDGYDVADYCGIDSSCGTPGDFNTFLYRAHSMGIRVMMDMILAHTSDQHPWFLRASSDSHSRYRDWYFWSPQKPAAQNKGMAFPGVQKETWTWQPQAKAWYFHRFYDFQPHLNFVNPAVVKEAQQILGYWLDHGIDGFRIDAVPFIVEIPHPQDDQAGHMLTLITALRQFVQWRKGDAVLLGEANVPSKESTDYFGATGDRLHMMFNFFANQYLFYALASGQTALLRQALVQTKDIPAVAQWAWFLRNHDEIDLGRLTDQQREFVYSRFGPEKNMQLYHRGIRRRLAPMLHNRKQLEMAYSLLFSLPGSVELHYGEELGMGDDLQLKERLSVRTPMPWTNGKNAGFSTSDHPLRPLVTGEYGYQRYNVQTEQNDTASLLEHVRRFAALRRECPEIGLGTWSVPDSSNPHLLVLRYEDGPRRLMVIHNFDDHDQDFLLPIDSSSNTARDLFTREEFHWHDARAPVSIPAYGYRWLRLSSEQPDAK